MTSQPMTSETMTTDRFRYDTLTQAIHWLTLIGVAGVLVSGQIMDDMARGPAKSQLVALHISIGVLVLALTLARLGRRLVTPQPAPIPGSPLVQMAASAMHMTLYLALVLVPLAGMLMVWAKGRSVGVFGLFTLPPLIGPDRDLAERLGDMHELGANLIMILVGVHAAAAIIHHVVLKDGAIARMLPFGTPRHG